MDIGLKHCLVFCHVGNPWGNRETKKNDQHQHALNALGETGGDSRILQISRLNRGKDSQDLTSFYVRSDSFPERSWWPEAPA